jgi:MoaA/NifB/PqqE/SkfB family radical SAM enzyme
MHNKLTTIKNFLTFYKAPFCYAPFGSLYFYQNGDVVACCQNRMNVLGKYPKNSVMEIWQGDKIKELRKYMLNHDLSKGCFSCNPSGTDSKLHLQYDFLDTNVKYPKHFIFQLSNVCNLKCKMCNHENSFNIEAVKSGHKIYNLYDDKFVDQIEEFLPYVEKISFLGGETFLINIFYDLWERIIKVNNKIVIDVLSNGTIYNERIENILNRGDFEVSLSIDSFNKETYEKIRVNANFEETMKNVGYFSKYMQKKGKSLTIDVCFMIDNWEEIPYIFDYCGKNNFNVFINYVIWPKHSSIQFLNYIKLTEIYNYIYFHQERIDWIDNLENKQIYTQIVQQLKSWVTEAEQFEQSELFGISDAEKLQDLLRIKVISFVENEMHYLLKEEADKLVYETGKRINNTQEFLSSKGEFVELLKSLHRIPIYEIVMEGSNEDEDTAMDRFMMFK